MGFLYYAAVPSGHNAKLYNDNEPLTRHKAGAIPDAPSPTSLQASFHVRQDLQADRGIRTTDAGPGAPLNSVRYLILSRGR